MKKLLIIAVLSLGLWIPAQAQVQDPCLVSLEREADLRKRAEAERDAYKTQVKSYEFLVGRYEDQVKLLEGIISNLDRQGSVSGEIDKKTQMIIDNLRVQVSELRSELAATRKDLDRERRNGNIKLAVGLAGGLVVGTKIN